MIKVNLKWLEVGDPTLYIFLEELKVIESIVTVVYKQGHLVLGF